MAMPSLAQETGTVAGLVRTAEGEPLPGATVRLEGTMLGDVADANGRFRLGRVPVGTYTVEATYIGFEPARAAVTVTGGATATIELILPEQALVLDDLVVTAQKRVEEIQEVPVAITAYSGTFLESIGVQELDNFAAYVPGLEVQIQSPNNPGFVVRGITSDSGDSRIEPRVSVFQDGVSISKSRGSVVELFDLERVEVLKGPQGTLFGRGAQIGAVHLIQNKPTSLFAAEATVGTGNYGELFAEGFVNAPLVEGRLFGRVAAILNQRDGFIDNLSGGDLNGKETVAARASLRWLPTSRTVVDLIANVQRDTPPGTSFKSGSFAPAGGDREPGTAADLERGDELGLERTVWGVTLLADHSLSQAFTLESITAFRRFDSYESFDADGTVAPALWFAEDAEGDQFSQELRVTYDAGGRLSGFGGANLFWEDGSQRVPFETDERSLFALLSPFLVDAGALPVIFPLVLNGEANLLPQFGGTNPVTGQPFKTAHREAFTNFGTTTAVEAFADGTLALTPRLDVTAGVRLTYEDVTAQYEVEDSATPGGLGIILGASPNNLFVSTNGQRLEASETFTSAVGRLAADYNVAGATNVFATVARGRRPNVINVTATATDVLDEEIVWSYEAGVKSLARGERLDLTASAFYYDYSNFQTNVSTIEDGEQIFRPEDSGAATALGVEATARALLARGVTVHGSYGYTDATFDDEDADGNPQELAGNRFRLTPEHAVSLGADLNVPTGFGAAFLRPTYTWKSQVFFEESNEPGVEQDAYGLLNVRAGLEVSGGRFAVEGFVKNALDEDYIIDAGNTGGSFLIPTFIAGPPRLYGVRLTARY